MNSFDIDLLQFLAKGSFCPGVSIGVSVDVIFNIFGQPIQVVGDNKVGHLNYDRGVRIGYFNKYVDELAIVFWGNSEAAYGIELDFEIEVISGTTSINKLISMLNRNKISWRTNDERNINVFSIVTSASVYVLFDLETGFLTKIAKVN